MENILAKTRTCKICKKTIDRKCERMIKQSSSFIHYECYVQKKMNGKIKNNINDVIKLANTYEDKAKDYEQSLIKKDDLYQYVMSYYDIVVLPNSFFVKTDSIFCGKYKNMSRGIPPTDLLDMWKRQQSFLDKTYQYNITHGKEFKDTMGRINYDFAILVNKYDSYLNWKKQQISIANNIENNNKIIESNKQSDIIFKNATTKMKNNIKQKNKISQELSDILDDI